MTILHVAIVEDDPRYRDGLETFLRHAPACELAASFGSAEAILGEARTAVAGGSVPRWDAVLMDLELPRMGGIEATRALKELVPGMAVVVLTVFEEPSIILQAIAAGADGYLLKRTSAPEMLAQLRTIAGGGAPLTADVARTVLDLLRRPAARGPSAPTRLELTEREQEVLRCLVQGRSYKQAADVLGVGIETIRTHVKAVYRKLQVHSVAAAVTRALREGLV